MKKEELKKFEESRLQIRQAAEDIRYGSSSEVAIKIMEQELASLYNLNMNPQKRPSDEMLYAIRSAGSLVIDCELCGRTHFATAREGYYDDPEELQDLRAKAESEPAKYVEDASDDSISWGMIDGKQVVLDCPCNGARRYEEWIWRNRYAIADYLEARAKKLRSAADSASQISKTAFSSVYE